MKIKNYDSYDEDAHTSTLLQQASKCVYEVARQREFKEFQETAARLSGAARVALFWVIENKTEEERAFEHQQEMKQWHEKEEATRKLIEFVNKQMANADCC